VVSAAAVLLSAGSATAETGPYANLASAFDNVGVSTAQTFTSGNFDGTDKSYAQELLTNQPKLPGQTGASLTPGQSFTHDGLTFTWPSTAGTGNPDNVLAEGQTIALSGRGTTLGFVGASSYGMTDGVGTINYTDGTQDSFELSFNDWNAGVPGFGSAAPDEVSSTSAFYATGPTTPFAVDIYGAVVSVDPGKTVASVTLPDVTAGPVASGTATMHIFAMALGSPPASS
jgi:hypothetical protein